MLFLRCSTLKRWETFCFHWSKLQLYVPENLKSWSKKHMDCYYMISFPRSLRKWPKMKITHANAALDYLCWCFPLLGAGYTADTLTQETLRCINDGSIPLLWCCISYCETWCSWAAVHVVKSTWVFPAETSQNVWCATKRCFINDCHPFIWL